MYTNSTHNWVHNGLVHNIEMASGVKFNKPYFSRDYSYSNMQKSLSYSYDTIVKSLEKKYPSLKNPKYVKEVFTNNIMFIDDIEYNIGDYFQKQLQCPKYDFSYTYNILSKIKRQYKVNPKIFEQILSDYDLSQYNQLYLYQPKSTKKERELSKLKWKYQKKNDEKDNKRDTFFKKTYKIYEKI